MKNLAPPAYGISQFVLTYIIRRGSAWLYTKSIPTREHCTQHQKSTQSIKINFSMLLTASKSLVGTLCHRLCMAHCVAAFFYANKQAIATTM